MQGKNISASAKHLVCPAAERWESLQCEGPPTANTQYYEERLSYTNSVYCL